MAQVFSQALSRLNGKFQAILIGSSNLPFFNTTPSITPKTIANTTIIYIGNIKNWLILTLNIIMQVYLWKNETLHNPRQAKKKKKN